MNTRPALDEAVAERWREEQRRTYSSGDSAHLARLQQPIAEHLVLAAGISRGERVLDIGAGTGSVAIGAARRGGMVAAVDITPRQVHDGRARCAAEGVDVTWDVADAEALPFLDGSFDVVLSSFGVVYAARPERAAAEVLRVLATGGRALVTAYPRDSFNGRVREVLARYLADGLEAPAVDEYLWSDTDTLHEWFGPRAVEVSHHDKDAAPYPSLEAWWDSLRGVPLVERMRAELPTERFAELRSEIMGLQASYARIDADGTVRPSNGYVLVRIS